MTIQPDLGSKSVDLKESLALGNGHHMHMAYGSWSNHALQLSSIASLYKIYIMSQSCVNPVIGFPSDILYKTEHKAHQDHEELVSVKEPQDFPPSVLSSGSFVVHNS